VMKAMATTLHIPLNIMAGLEGVMECQNPERRTRKPRRSRCPLFV
jgi:hypothetical protein